MHQSWGQNVFASIVKGGGRKTRLEQSEMYQGWWGCSLSHETRYQGRVEELMSRVTKLRAWDLAIKNR